MEYREHPAPGVAEHTGAGVYYGAATTEAPAFAGRRVLVVGGGNSAGQAAMYLSRYAKDVQIVVRRDVAARHDVAVPDRADREDAEHPAADRGPRSSASKATATSNASRSRPTTGQRADRGRSTRVFVFIGTRPRSDWLPADVLRDAKGFVHHRPGPGGATPAYARIWKERREPMPLETSVPGVFAAGDIRAGAMNRVASAVGEGSMVVRFVHEYLALT